jgi:hypothetical protein
MGIADAQDRKWWPHVAVPEKVKKDYSACSRSMALYHTLHGFSIHSHAGLDSAGSFVYCKNMRIVTFRLHSS